MKFALMKTTDNKYLSYDSYRSLIEKEQTDKDKKTVYLYATDAVAQYQYIEAAKSKGYQVLLFDSQLDAHFVNLLETKLKDAKFLRVDSDTIDNLIVKGDVEKPQLKEGEEADLQSIITAIMPKEDRYNVVAENMGEGNVPMLITQNEFMRRYKEMSALGGGLNFYGETPNSYTVKLNWQHPLIQQIMKAKDAETLKAVAEIKADLKDEEKKAERQAVMAKFAEGNTLLKQLADLALLSNGQLKGEALNSFVRRSLSLLK